MSIWACEFRIIEEEFKKISYKCNGLCSSVTGGFILQQVVFHGEICYGHFGKYDTKGKEGYPDGFFLQELDGKAQEYSAGNETEEHDDIDPSVFQEGNIYYMYGF